jgi:1,4-alpha-glucan branching enzyme
MTIFLPYFIYGCVYQLQPGGGLKGDAPVRFIFNNAQAREVCLAGSFNQWSPEGNCMARTGEIWALDVLLPRGRHEYVFVIDGHTWQPDPGAVMFEETGFGTKNSILIVE